MLVAIPHLVALDEAEARAAGSLIAAFAKRAAPSKAAFLQIAKPAGAPRVLLRPVIEISLGIAEFAFIVRMLDARTDIFDADMAMRPAFLAGGSVAAFGR